MEINYIDIHTHHAYKTTDDVIFIRQAYMHSFTPNANNYFVSKGLHPWFIEQKFEEDFFIKLISNPKVLAIGECGLDRSKPGFEVQKELFFKQMNIANQLGKPMILHVVKAYDEMELMLRESKVPVILHQYLGNEIQTIKLLKNKWVYFSFGKNLSHPKSRTVMSQIPLDRIFLETDVSSKSIKEVYLEFEKLRPIKMDELQLIMKANFEKVFGLVP